MKTYLLIILITGLVWVMTAAANPAAASSRMTRGISILTVKDTLVLGSVSSNPKKHAGRYKPILNYVVEKMSDLGIKKGRVLLARENREMVQFLKSGQIDWVTDSLYSAILFSKATGSEIMLRRWKNGIPYYCTVFITRKDTKLKSLKNIHGKTMALTYPGSTAGCFIPLTVLTKEGFDIIELDNLQTPPPPGKVGYVFTGGGSSVPGFVKQGLVDMGAYSNLDWENLNITPAGFKKDLKIFHQAKPVPRAVEMIRGDLNPRIKKRLKSILLEIHKDPKGQEALRAYDGTKKFDEISNYSQKYIDQLRDKWEEFLGGHDKGIEPLFR